MDEPIYAAVVNGDKLQIAIKEKSNISISEIEVKTDIAASLISYLSDYQRNNKLKIRGIAVNLKDENWQIVYPQLWLELDISPFRTKEDDLKKAVNWVRAKFANDHSYIAEVDKERKVITHPLVALSDYEKITSPDIFEKLVENSKKFDKRVIYISATPQGGGVAIMRHAQIRLAKLLNLKMDWYVLKDDEKIFDITKRKFHNILQNISAPSIALSDDEKKLFLKWSKQNYEILKYPIKQADIVVIDDPQPAGLVKFIKRDYPNKKIIYRSHIHLFASLADEVNTSQHITWEFISQFANQCDLFVSHPKKEFVPKNVSKKKLIYSAPSTDRLDGLNKELTQEQMDYYMHRVNEALEQDGQTAIDLKRPYITQIARFDPSKGIIDVMEAYKALVEKCQKNNKTIPQLVIAGNSSVDDPDGVPIYNAVMQKVKTDNFNDIKNDIKVIRLPHYDQLLNTILRKCFVALQLSHREGFEFKITEAIWKGKPTIIYNSGGMDLQIKHGKNGYVVETGDISTVSKHLYKLFSDVELYNKMSKCAQDSHLYEFSTVGNMIDWLTIFPLAFSKQ